MVEISERESRIGRIYPVEVIRDRLLESSQRAYLELLHNERISEVTMTFNYGKGYFRWY